MSAQGASEPERGDEGRSLGTLIDDYMRDHGLTLEAMAAQADLSLATVAALRIGTRGKRPRQTTLRKLAEVLGVDLGTLETAVARGASSGRARENALLDDFRALDDEGKRQVEDLAERLRRG